MGKIVLLVSREEMIYQAHNILQEKQYEIQEMMHFPHGSVSHPFRHQQSYHI